MASSGVSLKMRVWMIQDDQLQKGGESERVQFVWNHDAIAIKGQAVVVIEFCIFPEHVRLGWSS